MRIYVASSNAGKLRDFGYAAQQSGGRVEIVPLPMLGDLAAPPENEATFEGNARVKALYYAHAAARELPGVLVLADDSGLEVGSLEGAPGVRSARFAEDMGFPRAATATSIAAGNVDERNNAALLRALDSVPRPCRQGRYRCALALVRGEQLVATAEGVLAGEILEAPRGEAGFGYDPLFCVREAGVPGVGKTMAEMEMGERLELSHRGRALRRLLAGLGL